MNVHRVLLGLGAGAATVFALQTGALFGALGAPMTSDGRTYDPSKFGLSIGGVFAGFVTQMSGGFASTDVVNEKIGAEYSYVKTKHIAGVKYDDFSFKVGPNMSRSLYDWVRASQNGEYVRRDGAFEICDGNYNEVRHITFLNGLITEITFPALDAASKDDGFISVKFSPEEVKYAQGDGKAINASATSKVQKAWRLSGFHVALDGLDTSHVSKVEAFTFKQNVIEAAVGTTRDPVKMPAQMSLTNLKITIPVADMGSYQSWHQSVVTAGNQLEAGKKTGAVVYLDPSMHELARITLTNVSFVQMTVDRVEAGQTKPTHATVELSVERAIFTPASGTTFD